MATIAAPRDLLLTELQSMLYVEEKLANEVLPELSEQVNDSDFREALTEHLQETRGHVSNLERAIGILGEEPKADKSHAIDGLVAQHEKVIKQIEHSELRDLFNSGAAAKTEHLEIAAYESMIGSAEQLGEEEIVGLLEHNRDDEEQALKKVEKISEKLVKESAKV